MALSYSCKHCGKSHEYDNEEEGQQFDCSQCGTPITVPGRFECHNCGKGFAFENEQRGRSINCTECNTSLVIPGPKTSATEDPFQGTAETRSEENSESGMDRLFKISPTELTALGWMVFLGIATVLFTVLLTVIDSESAYLPAVGALFLSLLTFAGARSALNAHGFAVLKSDNKRMSSVTSTPNDADFSFLRDDDEGDETLS